MTAQANTALHRMEAASDRLADVVRWLEARRDAAQLPAERSIYQSVLDKIETGADACPVYSADEHPVSGLLEED